MITSEHKTNFLAGVREDFKADFSWAYDCILQEAKQVIDEQEFSLESFERYLSVRLTTVLNTLRGNNENQSNHP